MRYLTRPCLSLMATFALSLVLSIAQDVSAQATYRITETNGAAIVPGTSDIGNHCDDCVTNISLPFAYRLYDQTFTSANVSSNGNIQFLSSSGSTFGCIPDGTVSYAIAGYWSDLLTTGSSEAGVSGIYTSISGTAPNRIFNIEWRTRYFNTGSGTAHFEIRLYEGQQRFDIIYGLINQNNSAGIGVQRTTNDSQYTSHSCDTIPETAGLQLSFVPGSSVLISEFRFRGPNGVRDEFVELYNNTDADITVSTADGTAGWALVARGDDGVVYLWFVIPNGTVIPARGHYLLVSGGGYSLQSQATGDHSYSYVPTLADGGGVGLFRSVNGRLDKDYLDSVGFNSETHSHLHEGTGINYSGGVTKNEQFSFVRKVSATTGKPQDTNNNAQDFVFVAPETSKLLPAPNGTIIPTLGAPGPENTDSPIPRSKTEAVSSLIDPAQGASVAPNRVRDMTPATNGANGTMSFRRRYTNNTGRALTRLRFRIIEITTLQSSVVVTPPQADLRALSSPDINVTLTDGTTVLVRGTTLDEPPAQPDGGGLNSTLSAGTITLAAPLAHGQSIDVQFLLGVQSSGSFKFFVQVEALH